MYYACLVLGFPVLCKHFERRHVVATVEYRQYRGHVLKVEFVSRQRLGPCFGKAFGRIGQETCEAWVREDLSPRVKRFVVAHELYHLVDRHRWLGAYGRELRTNVVPGCRDPIGLLACVCATVFSWERVKFYCHRLIKGY